MNKIVVVASLLAGVAGAPSRAQVSIATSFEVGHPPRGMVIHRGANRAYVFSVGLAQGKIDVIDLATQQRIGDVATGRSGFAFSPDESLLAVGSLGNIGDKILLHRTDSLESPPVEVSVLGDVTAVELSFQDDRTLVAVATDGFGFGTSIQTIDCETFASSPAARLVPGGRVLGRIPNRRAVLVGTWGSVDVFELDPPRAAGSVTVSATPVQAIFDADGSAAWVLTRVYSGQSGTVGSCWIDRVDLEARTVTHSWSTAAFAGQFAKDERRGTFVVSCAGSNGCVQVLDAATGDILSTIPVPGAYGPQLLPELGLALAPYAGVIQVVDVAPESATFGTVVQNVPLEPCASGACNPLAVVVRPDGRFGYVLLGNDRRIDVLALPVAPATVTLVPRAYRVLAGTSLPFDVIVRNATDAPLAIDAWFDVLRPNGQPIALNPVIGPASHVFAPQREVRRSLALRVGAGARPGGPFTLRAAVGSFPSSSLDVSEIHFAIGP